MKYFHFFKKKSFLFRILSFVSVFLVCLVLTARSDAKGKRGEVPGRAHKRRKVKASPGQKREEWEDQNAGYFKCAGLVGLVECCELPAASLAYQARGYCGYRQGPTRVMPLSRQDDGDVRAPALACTGCVSWCCFTRGRASWWWVCGVTLSVFSKNG